MNFEKNNWHDMHFCHDFPEIAETASTVEIRDNFGQKRFEVHMQKKPMPYVQGRHKHFQPYGVDVVAFWNAEEPQTILCREFSDWHDTKKFFDDTVIQYRSLVLAETRDWQDARIYADKTGYRKTCPECCANCKWSKQSVCGWEFQSGLKREDYRLICTNSEIYKSKARQHAPTIHPDVQPDCICDHFERQLGGK